MVNSVMRKMTERFVQRFKQRRSSVSGTNNMKDEYTQSIVTLFST